MTAVSAVLVADRNHRNLELVSELLGVAGFAARTSATLEELERSLSDVDDIALVLVDASSFDVRRVMKGLKRPDVPLFVLCDAHHAAGAWRYLACGVRGVILKPVVASELLGIVRGVAGETHGSGPAAARQY
jgi:DNA-binding response OmpR family regulator